MAFCSKCGHRLNGDELFCPKCGYQTAMAQHAHIDAGKAKKATPVSNAEIQTTETNQFKDYLSKISSRLNVQPEYSHEYDAYCFRLNEFVPSAMSKYHYYFFIHNDNTANGASFLAYADRCFNDIWNKPHQTALAANQIVLPILCQEHVSSDTVRCLSNSIIQKHTFSSGMICYPVILEISSGKMFFPTNTPVYGCAIWPRLKKMCNEKLYYYP